MSLETAVTPSAPKAIKHLTREERMARGKAARATAPRSEQAKLDLDKRADPIALLEQQEKSRVQELVPIRHGRMAQSPFAFYRGAALVMASDLSRTPCSGLRAQLCGDAHLANFGVFGSPERKLVFDINDFDETHPGPWEWDVKRLAVSLEVACRAGGLSSQDRQDVVTDCVREYREAVNTFAAMHNLDVWYARADVDAAFATYKKEMHAKQVKRGSEAIAKAETKSSAEAFEKLTRVVNGRRRIVSTPPLIVPIDELFSASEVARLEESVRAVMRRFRASLQFDRRKLLEQYRFVEVARKVVGVGSVGTRCWIALFLGIDDDDPLFLQVKEAEASVLERFTAPSKFATHGERVVSGQRLMQAASDILLGWTRIPGVDGIERDYYVRQLHDWKGSFVREDMVPRGACIYARLCGWTLARAHARSGDRVAISAYLGKSDAFDKAIASFARAYADLTERDHDTFSRAIRSGRLKAETGV